MDENIESVSQYTQYFNEFSGSQSLQDWVGEDREKAQFVRNFMRLSEGDRRFIEGILEIQDSSGVYDSYNISNCMHVGNSEYIGSSRFITYCSQVKNSRFCQNSSYVEDSQFISTSNYINNSSHIITSENVEFSSSVFKSESIVDSCFINISNNITNSAVLNCCSNVQNSLFCIGISNANTMSFNKPATGWRLAQEKDIITSIIEESVSEILLENADGTIGRDFSISIFEKLPIELYKAIQTFENYDESIAKLFFRNLER